ncbi:hypothetical protein CapIbe_024212 [Capra ibex]
MDTSLSLLILWLQLDWVSSKQDVSQSPEALSVREGDSLVLNCSYTDGALYFLQWFRQDPRKGLTSLLSIQANQKEKASGRITVSLDKSSRHSALYIATSQHSDSTTYLCAHLRHQRETWVQVSQSSDSFVGNLLERSSLPLHCSTMTLAFTLMLEMLLFLRAGAQSVTQPDDHITVSEGARLELKCNYSSSFSPYLFWRPVSGRS